MRRIKMNFMEILNKGRRDTKYNRKTANAIFNYK